MAMVPVLGLSVFLAIAAAIDLRSRRIPNGLLVAGLIAAVLCQAGFGGWTGITESLIGFLIGLALMLPGWLLRFTGGGDVKLLAVVGAFVGSSTVFYAFALSILVGAAIAVTYSIYVWAAKGASSPLMRYGVMMTNLLATGQLAYIRPDESEAVGRRFPLAPAIAMGSITASVWFS